jgi:hypothetical protein
MSENFINFILKPFYVTAWRWFYEKAEKNAVMIY